MNDLLVSLLRQNARLTNKQLAACLGKTENEIADEIKELENKGIIKGYSAIINEDLIDNDYVTAIIELKVTPKKDCGFDEIAKRIVAYDEVDSVSLMSGSYDLSITLRGKGVKDISLFVSQRLSTLDGVLSTTTHFVLKKYKEKGIVIEDEETDERGMVCP
jgi:DNA-binding Lrp family transcriptional regulator